MDKGTNDLISSVLSNPESLQMLTSIAKNLLSSTQQSTSPSNTVSQPNIENTQNSLEGTGISEGIPEIQSSVVTPSAPSNFDNRTNLLNSIKPYLKEDKQEKVDSIVKALGIAKIISNYTGSAGLFGKNN